MNRSGSFAPTLRQIRAFSAIFRLRKLSAVAEEMHVTQSAVSLMLRQMETELGARLFDRTTRSLQPTEVANEAIALAERILRDVDSLRTGLKDLTSMRKGRICLAATPTVAELLLPRAISGFASLHPDVRIEIDDCAPDQFISRVLGEDVDFGIGTPEQSAVGVNSKRLVRDHLSLVCQSDHPLARHQTLRWTDLAGHPIVTLRPGYGIRTLIDDTARQVGVKFEVINEVSFLPTALWMASCGLGASVMPSAFAKHSVHKGLAVKKLIAPIVSRDISVVTKRGRSLSPASASFIALLVKELAEGRGLPLRP
jgi:DNA-binding transcriptional LysR family regulator